MVILSYTINDMLKLNAKKLWSEHEAMSKTFKVKTFKVNVVTVS